MPLNFLPSTPIPQLVIPGLSPAYLQKQQIDAQREAQQAALQAQAVQAEADRQNQYNIHALEQRNAAPMRQLQIKALQDKIDQETAINRITGGDPYVAAAADQYTKEFNEAPPLTAEGRIDVPAMAIRAKERRDAKDLHQFIKTRTVDVKNPDGTISSYDENYDMRDNKVISSTNPAFNASKSAYYVEQELKQSEKADKKALQDQQARVDAETVIQNLNRIDDILAKGVKVNGLRAALSFWPGSAQNDVAKALDPIKSVITVERLRQMRQASPSGGALGPVSDFENRLLQATFGSLSLTQTAEQFNANLARVRHLFTKFMTKGLKPSDATPEELKKLGGSPEAPSSVPLGPPSGSSSPSASATTPVGTVKRDRTSGKYYEKVEGGWTEVSGPTP